MTTPRHAPAEEGCEMQVKTLEKDSKWTISVNLTNCDYKLSELTMK